LYLTYFQLNPNTYLIKSDDDKNEIQSKSNIKLESIPECGGETDASEAEINLSDLDLSSLTISTI
jgi:hypothetical protein